MSSNFLCVLFSYSFWFCQTSGDGIENNLHFDDECSSHPHLDSCAFHAVQLKSSSVSNTSGIQDAPCRFTAFSLTYASHKGVYSLPDAADGSEITTPCDFEGLPLGIGDVKFQCQAGKWTYQSLSCAACSETKLAVQIAGRSGDFDLPRGSFEGSEVTVPCASAGRAKFACRDGQWQLLHQTCSVCGATKFTLRYGEALGIFNLPRAASEHTTVDRPCAFGDSSYPLGQVNFACKAHGWSYDSNDCAVCPATTLQILRHGSTGSFELPIGRSEGDEVPMSCASLTSHGTRHYKYGQLIFACRAGQWIAANDNCTMCRKQVFRLRYGEHVGLFPLPNSSTEGVETEHSCEFGNQSYPFGKVQFSCRAGGWSYKTNTCAVCPGTNFSIRHGDSESNFTLPRTMDTGVKLHKACNFSGKVYPGVVKFACGPQGWALVQNRCSACGRVRSFQVRYGDHAGNFSLPRASSEGELIERPCTFGGKRYASGSVQFGCHQGRWQLDAVTCHDGVLHSKS
eukprot:TRINITY_DN22024_c0_g1_i1.p1 TRINITY_DN22024_c0_g1~~TRINITY_DN22024_c0_g1_i1.p1  ORF type:complete len:511 (-),score=36.05 TRINITY_DN22024_c0_g1_i1:183-1715(-)